ncbi:hypothetical protein ACPOL_3860 [Acidisarcina polymorpha]|uniref:Uncharacterized protein n=1 Tax=Acidisarcina polymorpha TaxID=2211140 RepID=A0A2Z5G227_9BACT|nr:hypothetical protein ACPOL_3860 [Acidisarcina polymorpha]
MDTTISLPAALELLYFSFRMLAGAQAPQSSLLEIRPCGTQRFPFACQPKYT